MPVWAEHLLADTEKTTVFTGNAKQAFVLLSKKVLDNIRTALGE